MPDPTSPTTLRGPLLWPVGPHRLVALADGVVSPDLPEPRPARAGDPDPEPGLILAGFADWHFHPVQLEIAGSVRDGTTPLLRWLHQWAWPTEATLRTADRCRSAAVTAVRKLADVGTQAGAAFCTPLPESASSFLDAAPASFLAGPAVMTVGDPPSLVRPLDPALADLDRLHAQFGPRLAVSPRFALSCDAASLRALGDFAASRGLLVQTHLAENADEVREIRTRFPDAADPLDVYARAGLVGPRTLLAHAIHVSDAELARIAAAGATVVHCPTSNRALGSGRMPLERLRRAGVRWVLGSDVGAGPHLCLLDAVAEALDQHDGHAALDATELLDRSTRTLGAVLRTDPEAEVPCGARPGAIVVRPPDGLDAARPEATGWADALIATWRRERSLTVVRSVTWRRDATRR